MAPSESLDAPRPQSALLGRSDDIEYSELRANNAQRIGKLSETTLSTGLDRGFVYRVTAISERYSSKAILRLHRLLTVRPLLQIEVSSVFFLRGCNRSCSSY